MIGEFIASTVGGGLLGWFGWHVVDHWRQRPILYWDPYLERWARTCTHPV